MSTDRSSRSKEGILPLAEACHQGNVSQVTYLLSNGSNPNFADKEKYTSFHSAANNAEILGQLFSSPHTPHNVNTCSSRGETPLHLACLYGNLDSVKLLVDNGADLGEKDGKENSVLHLSAASGSSSLIRWINSSIKDKGLLNSTNKDGDTPAHCAARLGCREAYSTLSRLGADLQLKNRWEHTPPDELKLHNSRGTETRRKASSQRHRQRNKGENSGPVNEGAGLRKDRCCSEPRLSGKRREGEQESEGSRSAIDIGGVTGPRKVPQASAGVGGERLKHGTSPLACSSLSCTNNQSTAISKGNSSLDAPTFNGSATPHTTSNHTHSGKRERTTLSSKSTPCLDGGPASKNSSSHAASKSATNVIPATSSGASSGTPISEHREMRRKETYTIVAPRLEKVKGMAGPTSHSEKLQRRTNRIRAESAGSGIRTQPHTPDLGSRGRTKSDLPPKRHESLV